VSEELKNAYEAVGKILDHISELERENAALRAFVGIPDGVTVASVEDIMALPVTFGLPIETLLKAAARSTKPVIRIVDSEPQPPTLYHIARKQPYATKSIIGEDVSIEKAVAECEKLTIGYKARAKSGYRWVMADGTTYGIERAEDRSSPEIVAVSIFTKTGIS